MQRDKKLLLKEDDVECICMFLGLISIRKQCSVKCLQKIESTGLKV